MSDYDPNNLKNYDRYGNTRYEVADDDGKAPFVVVAILVLIALVGGVLYFGVPQKDGDVAQAPRPTATERTITAPATTTTPPLARPDQGVTPPNQVTPNTPNPNPAKPE